MEENLGTVCVTGGTGFIASWLIKRLLDRGYAVRTTVRVDPEERKELSFLTDLPGAYRRLRIFKADLSYPDSFDEAISGCIGVFHVATPVDFENREPERIVIERSINGTIGILKSCLKSGTVRRVVYTSSASAVVFNRESSDVMDETFWSDEDFIRNSDSNARCYAISKTLTEKAALEFAAKNGLDLVTLIPSFVVGPFICPKFPGSVRNMLALLLGNKQEYHFLLNASMVHVDDVARAHIFLLENPDVTGRCICSSATLTIQEMAEFLSARYPGYGIPDANSLAVKGLLTLPGLSSMKLLNCGFSYNYGINEMFDGAIQCCKERGYL